MARDAALLAETVREAGALARSMFRTELKNWTKGASSPVSEADIATNDLIENRLRSATPDYGWLSEESVDNDTRLGKPLVWIVDPIDGTRAYLAGREDWCVSVALVAGATPVLAAVFAPVTDEFYFAARGQGATLNQRMVSASSGTELDFSRMAGPKPLVQRLSPSPDEITLFRESVRWRYGCAGSPTAASMPLLPAGQSRDWDLAAANLIVQEANGRMTALSGDAIRYNRREVTHGVLVAAGRDRHARIVEHFRNRPLP